MSNNKITTKSYFMKRLRDSGYVVDKVDHEFGDDSPVRWALLVDNGTSSVFVFCHLDGTFLFYDAQQYFKSPNLRLKTDSIEVIVESLNYLGIINKHSRYGKGIVEGPVVELV